MTDILGLAGWEVLGASQEDSQCIINARYTVQPEACQKCGVVGNLYKHGTKTAMYRDLPVRISPTVIRVDTQRYRCRDCGETFVQPMFGIEPDRRMTTRCVEFIREQCLRKTFTALAEFVGCTEGTIRNIAAEKVASITGDFSPYLPEWLGIDETMLAGEMRCILTDVRNRLPVDILPNRDKTTVINWLWQFRDAKHIKGIAMDMWRPYKDAARAVFPSLPVVIDKFHVVRMANTALDKVRILTQKERAKAVRVSWKRSKHQLLIEALGSQCESCGGTFDGDDLVASRIPPVLKGQRWKSGYLCPRCRARFHTGDANHGNQVSTPDCE